VEPSGRNQWQPVANRLPSKTAESTIAIDSPPGEGTRVAITLPIAAEPDPEQE